MELKPIYILGKRSTTNLHSNLYFINFKHTLSLYPITSETKISSWLSVVMHAHNPSSWIADLGLQHIWGQYGLEWGYLKGKQMYK